MTYDHHNRHPYHFRHARSLCILAACILCLALVWAVPVPAEEINPADYVDIPQEGGHGITINGQEFFFIDGQQVSKEDFIDHYVPKEGLAMLTIGGENHYFINGEEVSEDYYYQYQNDPTIWKEIPAEGLYSYSYNGTQYYAYNGEYVDEWTFMDLRYRDYAAKNDLPFYESEEDAWKAAYSYINSVNWDDKDQGIRLVFHADSVNPLSDLLYTDEGCNAHVNHAISYPYRSAVWLGDGYISMGIWMVPSEVHYQGFTAQEYNAAEEKADEIAKQFEGLSQLEQVEGVYRYLCDNIDYDDTLQHGSIYDALIEKRSVCMGYASAFQMIMEKLGVESWLCTGDNMDRGAGHAWNAVKIDDEVYYVDATFGDTSGLEDIYLLFGTNLRKDMYELGIPDHSYYESDISHFAAYDENGHIIIVDQLVDTITEWESETQPEIGTEVIEQETAELTLYEE